MVLDTAQLFKNYKKIVVVGDGMAGKTALLTRFVHPDTFTREYSPTIFENQSHFIEVNNQQVNTGSLPPRTNVLVIRHTDGEWTVHPRTGIIQFVRVQVSRESLDPSVDSFTVWCDL